MVDLSKSTDFKTVETSNKKTQIILAESKRSAKNYINSLKYRYNGKNPYIPNYIVDKEGEIYKILDDNQHTKFMGNDKVDKKSIVIVLENYGWLQKNALENKFLNYVGDIYKKEVFEKKWRDYLYWDKYEEKQIVSLSKLLIEICDKMFSYVITGKINIIKLTNMERELINNIPSNLIPNLTQNIIEEIITI